ncbi:MAG: hypothetical protein ACI9AT_002531 [Ulvibacter sp.]|jgi:hypothetical protein
MLNGVIVDPAGLTISSTPTPELTVNTDGSVDVTPGTPEGTYMIDYTICENNNPTNCDAATVTVNVIVPCPEIDTPVVCVVDNCDGTITLSTSATGTLLWSTTETTSSITVNSAGDYTVKATVDGCTSYPGTGTAAPNEPPADQTVNVNDCDKANAGAVVTTATNATGCDYQVTTITTWTGQADIVFDRFHIVKKMNEAVDQIRRQDQTQYRELKNSRYLWLKNHSNLTQEQQSKVEELSKAYQNIGSAYRLKELLKIVLDKPTTANE